VSLHSRAQCGCGCGGGWDEPAARRELADALALVRVGVWKPTRSEEMRRRAGSTRFDQYASRWLQAKIEGVYGEIAPSSQINYRSDVERHLVPAFGHLVIEEIDLDHCQSFKKRLQSEARVLKRAKIDRRDAQGRKREPLGPESIRKTLATLAMILEDGIGSIDALVVRRGALERQMTALVPDSPWAKKIARLRCLRGIHTLTAVLRPPGSVRISLTARRAHGPPAASWTNRKDPLTRAFSAALLTK
jgi:hypothetical protein